MMKKVWHYLFVAKDPVLMAMPYRRLIGFVLMVQGVLFVAIGLHEKGLI